MKPAPYRRFACLRVLLFALAALGLTVYTTAETPSQTQDGVEANADRVIRFATFNAAMSGKTADDLPARLARNDDAKLRKIAEIIQRVRPDVLLINEFDYDAQGQLAALFQENYLGVAQNQAEPIAFAHAYSPPVNTGLPTGLDLDGDGKTDGPGDAHGWGDYPGQYGMLLLSRFPLDLENIQTRQDQIWSWFPQSFYPEDYYPDQADRVLRLSSKNHVMVPIVVEGQPAFSVLISHPTPPVFDGPEDRNGKRNFDEIGLTTQMVNDAQHPVVVLGDLNADPNDGESLPGAIDQLLTNPRINDPQPKSKGAAAKAAADAGNNAQHGSDPALDTADWHDHGSRGSGNLRVDYVLPTTQWQVIDAGVFWPTPDEPHHDLITASDHRLVWVDLQLPAE